MQAPSYASARKSISKFLASLIISFLPNLVLHATKGIAPALSAAAIKASLSLGDIFPLLLHCIKSNTPFLAATKSVGEWLPELLITRYQGFHSASLPSAQSCTHACSSCSQYILN